MADPVARNPVPSLLLSLTKDHLDPGYAAAARRKQTGAGGSGRWVLVLGFVLVGCVFGVAISQATDSGSDSLQRETLTLVRDAEARAAELESERQTLVQAVDETQATALQNDVDGSSLLAELQALEFAAGADSASGPGITITVSEPAARSDLSDVSERTRGSSDAVVFDRDLQAVVNSLWVSGAEAVAIDDVRIGPGVTVRQAGGAMLVDNRPVFSPYTVSAIGSPAQLQTRFSVSDAYLRMSALAQLYRVGFDVRAAEDLDMPAAVVRTIRTATQGGTP